MTAQHLLIDRRLAIHILHEAQLASPASIAGVVLAEHGVPVRYLNRLADQPEAALWAQVVSYPLAPAVPTLAEMPATGLLLVVSLNTKGVLEMRAWQQLGGALQEHVIAIRD
jgi:hypothetical protein